MKSLLAYIGAYAIARTFEEVLRKTIEADQRNRAAEVFSKSIWLQRDEE